MHADRDNVVPVDFDALELPPVERPPSGYHFWSDLGVLV
jgi:hypothetical protein